MGPRKKRKKASTRVKSEKTNEKHTNKACNLPFAIGDEVLACWQDGLYYLAVVKTINEEKSKCQVSFEDGSIYWVLFKHIRTVAKNKEISCSVCDKTESAENNDIVVCDSCFYGYHQQCHTPVVEKQIVESGGEWFCRICVFSKAAKAGGALKSGSKSDALAAMKSVLPYNLDSLQWDGHHKYNTDETYCYCAGPGIWYYKMLECQECRQWFHEACLQCLDFPLLLGDRFYYFVCAVCNNGDEYLKRIQLKWSDIAALVLYNLSLKYDKKGFKNDDIQHFVQENWDALQCGDFQHALEEERMERLLAIFKQQKHKYRCVCVNGVTTWSLITRSAPCPSKGSLLHEEKLKTKMTSGFLDCNGNYLETGNIEAAESLSGQSEVYPECAPGTSQAVNSFQPPRFPSLSVYKNLFPSYKPRAHANDSPDFTSVCDRDQSDYGQCPTPGDKRPRSSDENMNEPIEKCFVDYVERLSDGITSYTGTNARLACGEDCVLLGRRLARNGRVEYLVQWSGVTPECFL